MYLSKCIINGFKSFADKVEIDFKQGFSAIVGPNGCGKSNIYEAILWVLGEQRPTSLRSSKMEEVIFSGTSTRSPVGMAEVTVFITDENHVLSDRSELKITRRLFRSGESEYYLNSQSCRLRDITQLLSKVGLGKNSYAFIGQGEVNDILKAKPKDLRLMFEEAAGIAEYKNQKFSTEAQLQKNQESVFRVEDLIKEIEKDCERLRERAKQAKEHQVIYDRLNNIRELLLTSQYYYLKQHIVNSKRSIEENKEQIDNNKLVIENLENNELLLKQKRESLVDESRDIDRQIVRNESRTVTYKERRNEVFDELQSITRDFNNKEEESKKELENFNLLKDEYADKKNSKNMVASLIENIEKEISILNESLKHSYGDINQEQFNSLMEKYQSLNVELASLRQKRLSSVDDIQRRSNDIKTTIMKYDEVKQEKDRLLEENQQYLQKYEKIVNELDDYDSKHNDSSNVLENLYNKITQAENQINSLTQKYSINKNKLEFYTKQSLDYSGYYNGVRHLMLDKSQNENKYQGLIGPVAELINVEEKFQTAISEALGSKSQYIVCNTSKNATEYIEELKIKRAGKATFLPLDSVKTYNNHAPENLTNHKAFVGKACDLIDYDSKIEKAILHLLGNVIIFKDAKSVISISPALRRNFLVVTLDGEIFYSSGLISGGKTKGNNNQDLIVRKEIIDSLEKQLEVEELNILKIKKELRLLSDERGKKRKEHEILLEKVKSLSNHKNELENYKSLYEVKIESNNDKLGELSKSIDSSKEELNSAKLEITKLDKEINDKVQIIKDIESELQSQKSHINEYNDLREKLSNAKSNLLLNKNRHESLEESLLTYDDRIISLKSRIGVLDTEVKKYKEALSEKKDLFEEIETKLESLNDELDQLYEEKRRVDNELETINNEIEKSFYKRKDLENAIEHSKTKLQELELDLVAIRTDLKYTEAEIYQHDIVLEEKSETISKSKVQRLQKEVNDLEKEHKKLGNIDYGAIEDLERKEERLKFLIEQKEDLEKTQEKLKKVIHDVDKICIKRLGDTIENIRLHFKNIFQDLFQGGSADIIWDLENNIFESGVSLRVSPPGKNVKNMNQLSGGEKALTAIALLLAFAKQRSSAFCIFDEVDAALDESNNLLLVDYLHEISKESQVLTITHSRHTMAHANFLYGVVMQEKGVSKVINVEMDNE